MIHTLPEIGGVYATQGRLIPPVVRQIVPLLEQEEIKLGIENGRTPAAELRAALDEIDNSNVGIVLDMANSLAVSEGWKEVTRTLAPHTVCVHYKDFIIRRAWHMMGFIYEGVPSGKGLVQTDWLLDELRASRHDYNVIIELWPPEQATYDETASLEKDWAAESVLYLRQYLLN